MSQADQEVQRAIRETKRHRVSTKKMPWEERWCKLWFERDQPLARVEIDTDLACILDEQGIGYAVTTEPVPSIVLDEPLTSLVIRWSDLHTMSRILRESGIPYSVSRDKRIPCPRCALDTGTTPSRMWRVSLDMGYPLLSLYHLDKETTRAFARGVHNTGTGLDVTPSEGSPSCFDLTFDGPVDHLLVDPADMAEIDLYLTWNRIDHSYSIVDTKPRETEAGDEDGERHPWRVCVRRVMNEGGLTNAHDPELSPTETWMSGPRTLETCAVSKRKAISNVLHRVAPNDAHGREVEDIGGITWYWKVIFCERLDKIEPEAAKDTEQEKAPSEPTQLKLF